MVGSSTERENSCGPGLGAGGEGGSGLRRTSQQRQEEAEGAQQPGEESDGRSPGSGEVQSAWR